MSGLFWDRLCPKYFYYCWWTYHASVLFWDMQCLKDLPMASMSELFLLCSKAPLFPNNCASSVPFLKRGVCSHSPFSTSTHPLKHWKGFQLLGIIWLHWIWNLQWRHVRSRPGIEPRPCIRARHPGHRITREVPSQAFILKILNTSKLQEFL